MAKTKKLKASRSAETRAAAEQALAKFRSAITAGQRNADLKPLLRKLLSRVSPPTGPHDGNIGVDAETLHEFATEVWMAGYEARMKREREDADEIDS